MPNLAAVCRDMSEEIVHREKRLSYFIYIDRAKYIRYLSDIYHTKNQDKIIFHNVTVRRNKDKKQTYAISVI